MTDLTLVPAGAGAGKTTRIQRTVAGWVSAGLVAPGRILAVTFTEAAAAELKARIRAQLIAQDQVAEALELERAYIGTIHGLGQRLLTEHAFGAGRAPVSRLLTEAERDLLIRLQMGGCGPLQEVMGDLARFGYAWNRQTGASAEDQFRADVLRTIDLLRGLGARGASPDVLAGALAALDAGYGPRAAEGAPLTDALRRAAQALLARFPEGIADQATSDAAIKAFRDDHARLRRAAETDALNSDWGLWQKLRTLRQSKRGAPTPEGYDALAQGVMEAAEALLIHPGPLTDARAHLAALIHGAQALMAGYDAAKRAGGLIDFADMITETEALLAARPEILAATLGEIDCVVIDEFQDTNPVQFSLLWRLARGAARALIVGDTKQAIMRFQGADPRLSGALHAACPEAVDPLDHNYRSDPRIMRFVNALGPVLFPEGYDALAPHRAETGVPALEALVLPKAKKDVSAPCIAAHVAALLHEGAQVSDRATGQLRAAQPSDVAVLCYTAAKAASVAKALRAEGFAVRIQADGWRAAPIIRVVRAALALVADPEDSHAALRYLTLGPARLPLQAALTLAIDGALATHAGLAPLLSLAEDAPHLTVAALLSKIIPAAGLRDWAATLEAPAQALADLARFEAEAQAFDALAADLKAAAGFHGASAQVFLGWLAAQTGRDVDRHPDAAGWSAPGIEICTWHAAKGREWPITVVAGLDYKFIARPNTLRAEFDGFDDLDAVLDHAGLGWLPDFAAPEKQAAFAEALVADDERDAARELYVALTRARDRLILALPTAPSKEKPRPERMVDLLRARSGLATTTDGTGLTICGESFPARVVMAADPDAGAEAAPDPQPVPRFGLARPHPGTPLRLWRTTPSGLIAPADAARPNLRLIALGAAVRRQRDGFDLATERGSAWHLAFRVAAERPERLAEVGPATGLAPDTVAQIAAQAAALRHWLLAEGFDRLHFELPLQEIAADGSEINAIVDLLAEGPQGLLIVDHKSGACPYPEARFAGYASQLQAYAGLAERAFAKPVRGLAVNWMNEGEVSVLDLQEVPA
ncbi:UvrD-helicase domain-containing protein [Rhodobacter capsulatus]|uniref:DNA 3'-5' helicase n=1 Tax=Rhodobacter capsulatus (strain ATCC BAA-309 / NBRC 16581 / SB1003) TaxID=272942 RepID=D5ASF4_RHOCB|nr:UvrD-helicase domain-containing protein [Rhodobacter capsulatus]ADE85045.1 UvrD/REP helicase family protein [Rhodobacter capsulatus SB 1003]ETD02073.1 UvrD/REP helicase [Rhodobacter capsulatus DE442]ETD77747.1 UvrD/REP helicase [Rhodobacter capsulatus R121]ETE54105.1 UvrD/REP helicase [Rhodobacter capsulatus Y262]MDS0926699.1 UvrD-helicase domain-containing protein [Rhodobacter capsulatus]